MKKNPLHEYTGIFKEDLFMSLSISSVSGTNFNSKTTTISSPINNSESIPMVLVKDQSKKVSAPEGTDDILAEAKRLTEIQKIEQFIDNGVTTGLFTKNKVVGKDWKLHNSLVFNSDKDLTNVFTNEGNLTLGKLRDTLHLKDGALKKANNLYFSDYTMSKGRGANLDLYYPKELGYDKLNIYIEDLPSEVQKYVKDKYFK